MPFENKSPGLRFEPCARVTLAAIAVCMAIGCSKATSPKGGTGTITGTVSSSQGGGLGSVTLQIAPDTGTEFDATTDANGNYTATGIPAGPGAITIFEAPLGCLDFSSHTYNLTRNATATANIVLDCNP